MVLSLLILVVGPLCTLAFVSKDGMVTTRPPGINSNRSPAFLPPQQPFPSAAGARQVGSTQSGSSSTQLNMFMGSDGGILGIGTPELVRDWKSRNSTMSGVSLFLYDTSGGTHGLYFPLAELVVWMFTYGSFVYLSIYAFSLLFSWWVTLCWVPLICTS